MNCILKYILSLALYCCIAFEALAQDALIVYYKDGNIDAIILNDIDSMVCSKIDVDSIYYESFQVQEIYTSDSTYRIPLANIDSIGFHTPEPVLNPDVTLLNEEWSQYIKSVGEHSILLDTSTPKNLIPEQGTVIVLDADNNNCPLGFAGRIHSVENAQEGVLIITTDIEFGDIYASILSVGRTYSVQKDNTRIGIFETGKGKEFTTEDFNVPLGPLSCKVSPKITMDYCICWNQPNLKNIVSLKVKQKYTGSINLDCQFENDYEPDPVWPTTILAPTTIPGFCIRLYLGGFVKASGSMDLSVTQPYEINGETGFRWIDNTFTPINTWNSSFGDTKYSLQLDGSISAGLAARLECSIACIINADVTAYIGPKISANFSLQKEGSNPIDYDTLKDSEVKLSLSTEVVPGYTFIGMEHQDFPLSLSFDKELLSWKIFPTFNNVNWTKDDTGFGGELSCEVEEDLLMPVELGWKLFDQKDNLFASYQVHESYQKQADWTNASMNWTPDNLPYGSHLKAYPTVKLLGIELLASPSVDTSTDIFVRTDGINDITKNSAIASGYVEGFEENTFLNVGIMYGTDSSSDKTYIKANDILDGAFNVQLDNLAVNTKYYYQAYALVDGTYYYGDKSHFTTKKEEKEEEDYIVPTAGELVDLGLSVKWSSCNLGATNPEEYGYYYCWGETKPTGWDAIYSYVIIDEKTETESYIDIGDDISGTQYDAATVSLGDGWRIPTYQDWQELWDKCTITVVNYNGVDGQLYTGPNGNSIFLPAAGWGIFMKPAEPGVRGHYWSSLNYGAYKQKEEERYRAIAFGFDLSTNYKRIEISEFRETKIPIRPVKD